MWGWWIFAVPPMAARPRLAHWVWLPGGYRIRVCQTSNRNMLKLSGGEGVYGLWINENRELEDGSVLGGTVWVLKCLPRAKKLEIYTHELAHAFNDWIHWYKEGML